MAKPEIALTSLLAPAFWQLGDQVTHDGCREAWLKGGRGSTKSSFVALMIVFGLLNNREANAIVYRKVAGTLRTSVFAQIKWAIHALESDSIFDCTVSPMEITCKATGQRILFRGADAADKSKSIKLDSGYFKYLWFEELTEFDGMEDIRTIQASIIRGGGHAITFYTYNPPQAAGSWVNREALQSVPGRLVHHSDYTLVPPEWLGEGFIAQAEALRKSNERAYRHAYLGEVTGTGAQVFDNISPRAIIPRERRVFDRFYNGGDFGFANDPDAFVRTHYDKRARTLYVLEEVYGVRMNADVLCSRVAWMIGRETVTCDSSEPRMINELKRHGINALPARKGAGSVEHGMRWLQELSAIVIDPAACPHAAWEFTLYEYRRDRSGELVSEYPDKNNHTIDAVRYALEDVSNQRVARVMSRDAMGI